MIKRPKIEAKMQLIEPTKYSPQNLYRALKFLRKKMTNSAHFNVVSILMGST
jgi:hypothetical protein